MFVSRKVICCMYILVLLFPSSFEENPFRQSPLPNTPAAIMPPECGPAYTSALDMSSFLDFLQSQTAHLVLEGSKRFPSSLTFSMVRPGIEGLRSTHMFWGVCKCYPTKLVMETSAQCLDCLTKIRVKILYFTCGSAPNFHIPTYGSYLSQLCYLRFSTLDSFPPDDNFCPTTPYS